MYAARTGNKQEVKHSFNTLLYCLHGKTEEIYIQPQWVWFVSTFKSESRTSQKWCTNHPTTTFTKNMAQNNALYTYSTHSL